MASRKCVKRNIAREEGRPVTDYVWRDGMLYYADGVQDGGQRISGAPEIHKRKTNSTTNRPPAHLRRREVDDGEEDRWRSTAGGRELLRQRSLLPW